LDGYVTNPLTDNSCLASFSPSAAPTAAPTLAPAAAPTAPTDAPTKIPLITAGMRIRGFSNPADFTPNHQVAFEKAVASAITGLTAANVQITNYQISAGELMVDYQIVSSNTTTRATAWAAIEQWKQRTTTREVWGDTVLRAAIEADGAAVPPGFGVTGATEPSQAVWSTHAPTFAPDGEIAAAPTPADGATGVQGLKFELVVAAIITMIIIIIMMVIAGYVLWKRFRHIEETVRKLQAQPATRNNEALNRPNNPLRTLGSTEKQTSTV
jgi:hypothetical protein